MSAALTAALAVLLCAGDSAAQTQRQTVRTDNAIETMCASLHQDRAARNRCVRTKLAEEKKKRSKGKTEQEAPLPTPPPRGPQLSRPKLDGRAPAVSATGAQGGAVDEACVSPRRPQKVKPDIWDRVVGMPNPEKAHEFLQATLEMCHGDRATMSEWLKKDCDENAFEDRELCLNYVRMARYCRDGFPRSRAEEKIKTLEVVIRHRVRCGEAP